MTAMPSRPLIRELLVCADLAGSLRRHRPGENAEFATLASAVFTVLAARRFAMPGDRRIPAFVDSAPAWAGTHQRIDATAAVRLIRATLGATALLDGVPADSVTVLHILLSRAIVAEHGATAVQIDAVLHAAEALATESGAR
ncbi:hypothetical protein [Amycolatopsis sp. CA-230715]|uniref:hypothetical protein n=1 Tax=Amycolatopsis sp. CA-230715 TaxID=2745196 RepID=UPI001C0287FE|nr:hypothetical protein [Amycolatopsis sp. CA-230715]QWF82445.1 hypothetical protein HUW46_05882 [Amycolatopsis sp. CA-230715]